MVVKGQNSCWDPGDCTGSQGTALCVGGPGDCTGNQGTALLLRSWELFLRSRDSTVVGVQGTVLALKEHIFQFLAVLHIFTNALLC